MTRWLGVGMVLVVAVFAAWQATLLLRSGVRSKHFARITTTAPPVFRVDIDENVLLSQILRDGQVDEQALNQIEKQGNTVVSAAAYYLAAKHEYEGKRYAPALKYIQRALDFDPGAASLHGWYAVLLLDSEQYAEAVSQGEKAAQLDPASADAQRILGLAYYDAGRIQDAVGAWQRSLELRPDAEVTQYLARAKRETVVEANFVESSTGHFVLRYEGGRPSESLLNDLSRTLESQYEALGSDLGFRPNTPITVVLYSAQQFTDVTQAPSWAWRTE